MNLTDKKSKKKKSEKEKIKYKFKWYKNEEKKNPTKKIIMPAAEDEGATHLKTLRLKDVKTIGFEIFPK